MKVGLRVGESEVIPLREGTKEGVEPVVGEVLSLELRDWDWEMVGVRVGVMVLDTVEVGDVEKEGDTVLDVHWVVEGVDVIDTEGERVGRREGVVGGEGELEMETEIESEEVKDGWEGEAEGLKVKEVEILSVGDIVMLVVEDTELVIETEIETVPERVAVQLIG